MRALGLRLLALFSSLYFLRFRPSVWRRINLRKISRHRDRRHARARDPRLAGRGRFAGCRGKSLQSAENGAGEESFHRRRYGSNCGSAAAAENGRSQNADDVVAAIKEYRAKHTPEETEEAVHIWYDRYDELLAAAIRQNQDIPALRSENMSNGNLLCQESQDYQKCWSRQMAEQRGAQSDQKVMARNVKLEVRVQHSLMKVRNGLNMMNLRYAWFKIRTTNDIDVF